MGLRLFIVPLALISAWNWYTTWLGVTDFFDLPTAFNINPGQWIFGVLVALMIFGFVFAFPVIWKLPDNIPSAILRASWMVCIVIVLYTAWTGTRSAIFYDDDDLGKDIGMAIVAILFVSATIGLSFILADKNLRKAG